MITRTNHHEPKSELTGGAQLISTRPAPLLGLSKDELRSYSLLKAIRELSDIDNGPALTGLELEASQAMAKLLKREPEKGFFLPPEVTRGASPTQRAIGVTLPPGTTGGELVPSELALPLIDYLRNWLVVKAAGAKLFTGLKGELVIPKQIGSATAEWVREIEEVDEEDQHFGQVALKPKRLSAMTIYSRQMVIQSSPDLEAVVREDLAKAIAQALDFSALFGTGVAPQPRGVLSQVGINRFTFGAEPLFPSYVSAIVSIDDSKVSIDRGAWISNPRSWGAGIITERFEWTGIPVIKESGPAGGPSGGSLLGYPYFKTQQIPNTGPNDGLVFFGNWSDLIIGTWDGTEIIVDPYTEARTAQIRVVILEFADLAVRYPEAFSVSTDSGYGNANLLAKVGAQKEKQRS